LTSKLHSEDNFAFLLQPIIAQGVCRRQKFPRRGRGRNPLRWPVEPVDRRLSLFRWRTPPSLTHATRPRISRHRAATLFRYVYFSAYKTYRHHNYIERMFRLKDARRIATRYDKCADNFLYSS